MPMTLAIPSEIALAAEEIAERSGASPEDLLIQALQAHFPPVSTELQAELDAWNLASDEDLAQFDRAQGVGLTLIAMVSPKCLAVFPGLRG